MSAYIPSGVTVVAGGSGGTGALVPLLPSVPITADVTGSSALVLPETALRKSLIITNLGDTNVYFGIDQAASVKAGIALTPDGTWVMDAFTFSTKAIYAVAEGNSIISIQEFI